MEKAQNEPTANLFSLGDQRTQVAARLMRSNTRVYFHFLSGPAIKGIFTLTIRTEPRYHFLYRQGKVRKVMAQIFFFTL
jgi:hypothetical protein